GGGWLPGLSMLSPDETPFGELLDNIGARLHTNDRKIAAAGFALRFGWASGVAIAPFLLYQCIPDVSLENIFLKFSEETFFQRVSLHKPRGVVSYHGELKAVPGIETQNLVLNVNAAATDNPELTSRLRATLIEQAEPVIDALYDWSRFSKRALWG